MQRYGLSVITPPSIEPLTLGETKLYLRVEHTADDTLIQALIRAAREWAQAETQRTIITTQLRLDLPCFPCEIKLPFAPVQSVEAVEYYDAEGDLIELDDAAYELWRDYEPPIVTPVNHWPNTGSRRPHNVQVTYIAGYGGLQQVPQSFRLAMLLWIGDRYERRGDEQQARGTHPAAAALLAQLRTSVSPL